MQTIHKTKEELREDRRRMREGVPPLPPKQSANYVGDVPDEFKAWVRKNGAMVVRSQSLPYFMQDNSKIVAKVFYEEQPSTNLSRNLITTIPYVNKYAERDPRVAAILDELDNNDASRTDFEQAMLANRLKSICANITYVDWKDAVKADIELAKANRGGMQMYPTDYAKTNLNEDFAESMAMFLTDRRKLKEIAPNRGDIYTICQNNWEMDCATNAPAFRNVHLP